MGVDGAAVEILPRGHTSGPPAPSCHSALELERSGDASLENPSDPLYYELAKMRSPFNQRLLSHRNPTRPVLCASCHQAPQPRLDPT